LVHFLGEQKMNKETFGRTKKEKEKTLEGQKNRSAAEFGEAK
jgi:hypothetical protein